MSESKWTEEEAKNLVCRIMNARNTYTLVLPSPNEGKRLIIKNQDIDTAYEIFRNIWTGEATADNYPKEVVEEYDCDLFVKLMIKGTAVNAMIIKDTHIVYKEPPPIKATEQPDYRQRMRYIFNTLGSHQVRLPIVGKSIIGKEDDHEKMAGFTDCAGFAGGIDDPGRV